MECRDQTNFLVEVGLGLQDLVNAFAFQHSHTNFGAHGFLVLHICFLQHYHIATREDLDGPFLDCSSCENFVVGEVQEALFIHAALPGLQIAD